MGGGLQVRLGATMQLNGAEQFIMCQVRSIPASTLAGDATDAAREHSSRRCTSSLSRSAG